MVDNDSIEPVPSLCGLVHSSCAQSEVGEVTSQYVDLIVWVLFLEVPQWSFAACDYHDFVGVLE
jgi:hypothetical protein